MSRPAPLDPEQATPKVKEALAGLPPLDVFRMVAHAETAFRPWLALGGALLSSLELDPKLRELAILRVAQITGCDYERAQHEPIALGVGASPEQVAAIAEGRSDGAEFGPEEEMVLRFVGETIEKSGADATRAAEVEEAFSARELVELLLVISHYHGLAMLLNTTGVEPESPAGMPLIDVATRIAED
jgi:4-carboxymuconolactone decarboxylase